MLTYAEHEIKFNDSGDRPKLVVVKSQRACFALDKCVRYVPDKRHHFSKWIGEKLLRLPP